MNQLLIQIANKIGIDKAIAYSSGARIIQAFTGFVSIFFIATFLSKEEQEAGNIVRKLIGNQNSVQAIETVEKIFNIFAKTKDNIEFMDTLKKQVVKKTNKE